MDRKFSLQLEALDIFKIIVSEFQSDPMSVQCFDLRIVHRAIEIDKKLRSLDPLYSL